MVRWLIAICAVLFTPRLAASQGVEIHLPTVPVTTQPADPEAPKPVDTLPADTWYIIESSEPLIVLASPVGLVTVEAETGPMKIRGKFADGSGKSETRTLSSKFLYTVEAVAKGNVELLIVPAGATESSDVIRQTLTVMGQGPQPPPEPKPYDPDVPVPPEPVKSFRVIFVKESGQTLPAGQSAIPGAKAIRDYLTSKTTPEGGFAGFREYDPDQTTANEQPTMRKLWETVKPQLLPAPCLVIEVNGKAIVQPFPADVAEAMVTLKKAGGE